MNTRPQRQERNVFLLFLGTCFVALMTALPIVTASQSQAPKKETPEIAAKLPEHPSFEEADGNKDGVVDKSEARVVPGLSANFERADRDKDGKLDKAEFARGLEILQARR